MFCNDGLCTSCYGFCDWAVFIWASVFWEYRVDGICHCACAVFWQYRVVTVFCILTTSIPSHPGLEFAVGVRCPPSSEGTFEESSLSLSERWIINFVSQKAISALKAIETQLDLPNLLNDLPSFGDDTRSSVAHYASHLHRVPASSGDNKANSLTSSKTR